MKDGVPASEPWAAQVLQGSQPHCTGSLIAPQWVLTAAHCFIDPRLARLFHVVVDGRIYDIEGRIHWEPSYVPGKVRWDVALLQLSAPVPNASPIALVPPSTEYSPVAGYPQFAAYGYGGTGAQLNETQPHSYGLTGSDKICPDVPTAWCFTWNEGYSQLVEGDSGGPWVVEPGAGLPDGGTLATNPMQLAATSFKFITTEAATDLTNVIIYNWVTKTAGTFLASPSPNAPCQYQGQTECIVQFPNGNYYLVGASSDSGTSGAGFGHLISDTATLTCLENEFPGLQPVPLGSSPSQEMSQSQEIPLDSTPATCLKITTAGLPDGSQGTSYTSTLAAQGGQQPYTWAVSSGSLPGGLALDPASGEISGTPTTAASSTFDVTVTDQNGATDTAALTLSITGSALEVTTTSLPVMWIGAPYSATLEAQGGTPPYTWKITQGSLPSGITLDPNTGVISGAQPQAASCPYAGCDATEGISVEVTDAKGQTGFTLYQIPFLVANTPPPCTSGCSLEAETSGSVIDITSPAYVPTECWQPYWSYGTYPDGSPEAYEDYCRLAIQVLDSDGYEDANGGDGVADDGNGYFYPADGQSPSTFHVPFGTGGDPGEACTGTQDYNAGNTTCAGDEAWDVLVYFVPGSGVTFLDISNAVTLPGS